MKYFWSIVTTLVLFSLPLSARAQYATPPFYNGVANFPLITNQFPIDLISGIDSSNRTFRIYNGYVWQALAPLQNNYIATAAPGATNDLSQGYSVNSLWYNASTGIWYIATSVTKNTASWLVFVSNSSSAGTSGQLLQSNGSSPQSFTSTPGSGTALTSLTAIKSISAGTVPTIAGKWFRGWLSGFRGNSAR